MHVPRSAAVEQRKGQRELANAGTEAPPETAPAATPEAEAQRGPYTAPEATSAPETRLPAPSPTPPVVEYAM